MAIGISIVGRDVTATVGGASLVGELSKNISFNGELLDTTDAASSGWAESAAVHGLKSVEMGLNGLLKNLELVGLYFGASQAVEVIWTFPDGGTTVTFDAVLSALSISGDANTGMTWDASLNSSGAVVYVAAV
jgi:predicted secreted protein